MRVAHWIVGMALGAAAAAGFAVPALQAREAPALRRAARALPFLGGDFGAFTPAAADPKLAAILARTGLPSSDFRFTPSEGHKAGRGVTVAIRARSNRAIVGNDRLASASAQTVGIAPIAYNMGATVGWRRLAVSGDVTHLDLATQPGSHDAVDLGVSYTGRRFSGRVRAAAERPLAGEPKLISDMPSYSIDVGGSYALTHNVDVSAGVRYKTERDRVPLRDAFADSHQSQAVYIGTAFRF